MDLTEPRNCKNLYLVTSGKTYTSIQQHRYLEAPKDFWGPNMFYKKNLLEKLIFHILSPVHSFTHSLVNNFFSFFSIENIYFNDKTLNSFHGANMPFFKDSKIGILWPYMMQKKCYRIYLWTSTPSCFLPGTFFGPDHLHSLSINKSLYLDTKGHRNFVH